MRIIKTMGGRVGNLVGRTLRIRNLNMSGRVVFFFLNCKLHSAVRHAGRQAGKQTCPHIQAKGGRLVGGLGGGGGRGGCACTAKQQQRILV